MNKESKEFYACKQLPKSRIKEYKRCQEEIAILKSLDHPNIINLYEVCEDERNIFLIMEECTGGSFEDYLLKTEGKKLNEKKVSEIMEAIFEAINHIHAQGICHRDIRPENILLSHPDDLSSLKLIGFALGKNISEQNDKSNFIVAAEYVAPEILNGKMDIKCDIWSAGVIMYSLLSGQMPFTGKNREEIYTNIKNEIANYPPKDWEKISPYAKDLLQKILCNSNSRLTSQQVLDHTWFKSIREEVHNKARLSNFNYNSVIEFSRMNKFKRSVLSFVALRINCKQLSALREQFRAMDSNDDGFITYEELQLAFDKLKINDFDLEDLFSQIDYNKKGFINYTEFLAATIDEKVHLNEEKLYEAFKMFDKDKSGKISPSEISEVLENEDIFSAKDLIKQYDIDGDGEIDYKEFCKMMGKDIKGKNKLDKFLEKFQ